MSKVAVLSAIALFLAAGTASVSAQEPFVRAPLQKSEYPAGYETHIMLVTSAPGALLPRHTHPGVEMSYVVEGELTVTIEGKEAVVVKAGSSFSVPPGAPHSAKNTASIPTKVLATFVVEKGKPVASPAP